MPDPTPTIRVVTAKIERDGRFLITQRSAHAVLPHLWEFPGGRVREGESDLEALARSVRDRLGVSVSPVHKAFEVVQDYPDYTVELVVYDCAIVTGEPDARTVQALAWVAPEALSDYEFPGADARTIELLLAVDEDPWS